MQPGRRARSVPSCGGRGCTRRFRGAALRREGLYSSHLAAWRRQREEGILHALAPRRRGRPMHSPEQRELVRLRQENERLGQRLAVAEAVIEIQKKVSVLLGLAERSNASSERS